MSRSRVAAILWLVLGFNLSAGFAALALPLSGELSLMNVTFSMAVFCGIATILVGLYGLVTEE